jgi:hypothetical protein
MTEPLNLTFSPWKGEKGNTRSTNVRSALGENKAFQVALPSPPKAFGGEGQGEGPARWTQR